MGQLAIVGAGAIGRGFLPWILDSAAYQFIFVEINRQLVENLNRQKQYRTYRVKSGKLEEIVVPVKRAYSPSEFSSGGQDLSAVFMNVGPRNCLTASKCLAGINCPLILCENDPQTVNIVKNALEYDKVYFAIPDVITSNTASPELLEKDPLSIVTEDGVLFVDERAKGIKGEINFCDEAELNKQWTAKLYLHNTSHCIAAYLGAYLGVSYIHEAMKVPEIKKIVKGAMSEMLAALKLRWDIPHTFLDWYAQKEIQRFCSELLYDPIYRVAREPLRKLKLGGRLIGAAQICLSLGFVPQNILIGIVSAILFENEQDSDHHLSFMYKILSPNSLVTYVLGLGKDEALELALRERLKKIILQLEDLKKNFKG